MLAFVYTCISFGVLYKQEKAKPFKVTTLLALGEDVLHDLIATRKGTLIALNVAASVVIFSALATTRVFLGQLSVIESQQLIDRMLRFILLKVLFLGAVVDPEPAANVAAYLVWACVTCALKAFVGLARWRLESLLSSPIATIWQHLRCVGLLAVMLAEDALWISAGLRLAGANSLYSWAFLWYFDAACVGIEGVHAGIRYFICGIDRLRAQRGGHCGEEEDEDTCTNLESQNQFFYMLDLASDLVVHALNLVHYGHILHLRGGLRLQLIDVALLTDVRFLLAAAWRRVQGHFLYRNLTHKLRHCFPDASLESLAKEGGVTCAICMENMRKSAKVLPCGHMYHLGCLREWLQQGKGSGFTCPICRANLLIDDEDDEEKEAERFARGRVSIVRRRSSQPRQHQSSLQTFRLPPTAAAVEWRDEVRAARNRPTIAVYYPSADDPYFLDNDDEEEDYRATDRNNDDHFSNSQVSNEIDSWGQDIEVDWDGASCRCHHQKYQHNQEKEEETIGGSSRHRRHGPRLQQNNKNSNDLNNAIGDDWETDISSCPSSSTVAFHRSFRPTSGWQQTPEAEEEGTTSGLARRPVTRSMSHGI